MSTSHIAEMVRSAGGITAVSERIGKPIGTVSSWISRNKVPAESAIQFARAVNVRPHDVRPDIYPSAEVA